MENKILFDVSILLFSGIICGRLSKFIKLPNVTGYLIAGLLLGPSVFNIISVDMVDNFTIISDIALGFIAFSIGSEFNLSYFRKVGVAPIIIAIAESGFAIIIVTSVLIILGFDLKLSIMLGAIAAATAPAQTIMVINQYKAKGSLTSMLMSVVAIDDATALIGFGFATTIVNMMSADKEFNLLLSILSPIYEIVISFILGAAISIVMKLLFRWFKKPSNRICIIVSLILLTYWSSTILHGSPLLACMSLGAVLVNIFDDIDGIISITDSFNPPIYMLFFVISGAGFEITALKGIGIIGLVYVVMRVIGKWLGAWTGGKLAKQEDKICKYLGPTLMPQAGVALGLVAVAGQLVPDYASQIRVIILCSTFIYSIIGPVVAKVSLVKSGEIVLSPRT
ncbi:cation:proton antiporter [Anaeromicropila populeti]|uniref:Transporter, CPA2 family (TC 2.A.37) n=1 Tax=Anaeromicropila populeti TaxID=37658 RepID=A0A1I6KRH1_9FIRM|nr:cation:proton antiporter [Anaeromicropila populeti]SFR93832.1 transporter, CPA2 family (TC 2.A.37) [Anaeromicropila populeti]